MNKRLFKSLLFREYYVSRKFFMLAMLCYLMTILVSLLALLSCQWGNLHQYSHLMSETVKKGLDNVIRFAPVIIATSFFEGAMDSVPSDEKIGWRRFRTACPATPFQLALAKYSCLFLTMLISFVMVMGWLGLYNLLTGTPVNSKDIIFLFGIYSAEVLLYLIIINLTIWLGNSDFAVFIFLGIFFGSFIIIALLDPDFSKTKAFGISLLPFTPLIILVLFILGILCTTILYKRRER